MIKPMGMNPAMFQASSRLRFAGEKPDINAVENKIRVAFDAKNIEYEIPSANKKDTILLHVPRKDLDQAKAILKKLAKGNVENNDLMMKQESWIDGYWVGLFQSDPDNSILKKFIE